MAKVETLKAEAAKRAAREAAAKTAAVTNLDPAGLTWEEYKKAVNEKRGGGTIPDRIMTKLRNQWNSANPTSSTPPSIPNANASTKPSINSPVKPIVNPEPGFKAVGNGGTVSSQPHVGENSGTVEDFAATLKNSRNELKKMPEATRLALAKQLTNAGFAAPQTGVYTDQLWSAYQAAISSAQSAYKTYKEFPTLQSFLADRATQQAAVNAASGGSGTGKANAYTDTTIFDPTTAVNYINSEFQQFLKRDATPKEVATLTKKLQAAQRSKPDKVTTDANGNRKIEKGIDAQGFLDGEIKKLPEFADKLKAKTVANTESIISTAKANGILVNQNQIDTWNKRVQNGEDPSAISAEIRSMAANGRPEAIATQLKAGNDLSTILSPYKTYMQNILEIPADQIDMHDPSLQLAISGDKPMSLYDYQNALRKDNRWQYTNNAKTAVSDTVQKVLQDFGFMG